MATEKTRPKVQSLSYQAAQASLEYFILFAIIAVLTILSFSSFLPKVKESIMGSAQKDGFFQKAAKQITQ